MIRVRRINQDQEETCTIKTLKQWARSGELLGSDMVYQESEWIPAKQHPALSGVFAANVWDLPEDTAWSSTLPPKDSNGPFVQEEPLVEQSKSLPKLPLSAIEPLEPSTPSNNKSASTSTDASTISIVEDYQRSMVKPSPSHTSSESTRSTVTTEKFATKSVQPVDPSIPVTSTSQVNLHGAPKELNEMWNPEMDLKDQPGLWADTAPPPKSTFSWFRLSLLVVPGAFAIFLARSFVISEAQTEFPLDVSETENAPIPNELVTDPLLELEDRLKSKLRRDTQMVSPEQSLSDALRVDLEYVGLDIVRLDSKVLSWTGRKLDQPKSASIQVYLNPSENFEEDLLLASLVVAKYAVRYFLEMETFDVFLKMDDVYIQKTIPTEQARFLLIQPGSLKPFLLSLSEQPR